MIPSKDFHPHPSSDELLAFYFLSNQSLYPGSDCEATMLQEALAVTNNPPAEKKGNHLLSLGLEILASLLLIGIGLLFQLGNQAEIAVPSVEVQKAENID